MKIFGIIPNKDKDKGLSFTRILIDCIHNKGGKTLLSSDVAEELGIECEKIDEETLIRKAEVMICLGGDGTLLKLARNAYMSGTPLLGVNLGSLGFLTEVEKSDIDHAIDRLMKDDFEIEERIMLESIVMRDGNVIARDCALNDVIISRKALCRILHVKMYINNAFVDSFPGDGVIISSPTGSTGYSLSAGGPIVDPVNDLMILTPICPHTLYSRSFVTSGNRIVRVEIDENYCHEAMVTVDGQKGYEVRGGDYVEIKKAAHTVKMIRMNTMNFFSILRTKIFDRGENLKGNEV